MHTDALTGVTADVNCVAAGNPPPTVSWFVNGVPLSSKISYTVTGLAQRPVCCCCVVVPLLFRASVCLSLIHISEPTRRS